MAVVITGFGARSPLGCSYEESLDTLRAGTPCVGDIRNIDTRGYQYTAAGEIRRDGEVVRTPRGVDRKTFFLDQALEELSAKTGFTRRYRPDELMLNIGSGVDYFDIESYFDSGASFPDGILRDGSYHQLAADMRPLAAKWHFDAGCHLFASACTASAQAIGLSWRLLRRGLAGAVVSGGADSMISHPAFLGFSVLGALSASSEPAPVKCRPCDLHSSGTVLGEASVAMMMEDSARVGDGQEILAEMVGYGCSMDAWSVTDPEPSGAAAAEAVRAALDEAGITPEQIDCIHLHGTGTVKCAPAEYNGLHRIFGDRLKDIPAYSMKGQVGHMIGSCTAVEMLGVVYSLQHQAVLPTLNFRTPHPDAPFRMVRDTPLHLPVRYILKMNSAFGGHNTALIFKKWER
ncbi:MAG: hypothetical protein GXY24_07930 [Bacteroidales bacterium]|jgi:3-oxoacyl-[acyl-carrier-protein] synthase II|nr:hypothetical protein [Bacteroidales bacterium]